MNLRRTLKHLFTSRRAALRAFPPSAMDAIGEAIRQSELRHRGQVCFAVESVLDLKRLLRGMQPHERALEVFSRLRVWDTAENNGVLIYLLLADRHVEIVADRGIHGRAGAAAWEPVCREMERSFAAGRFQEGVGKGIDSVSAVLAREFPASGPDSNELPDRPVIVA